MQPPQPTPASADHDPVHPSHGAPPPAYEREPYARELHTEVLASGRSDGRAYLVLADTILYPEGGGQPADRGWTGETAVVDVQRVDGEIRHYLDAGRDAGDGPVDPAGGPDVGPIGAPAPGTAVHLRLDWPRRFEHMQQHTAQHLLTAIAADRFGWPTTAFHLGTEASDIELDVPALADEQLAALEEAVAAEIRAARPVTARRVAAGALAALPVRTRGLPHGHVGDVRLVEIEGIDLNTCGGTHLGSTAEIEALAFVGTEPMRGGTRLYFVAGGRLRRRLAEHEAREAELRRILGVPEDQLAREAAARLEQVRALTRTVGRLEAELGEALVRAWAADAAPVIHAHFADRDLGFLQGLARQFAAAAPGRVALLTAGPSGDSARGAGDGARGASGDGAFVWLAGDRGGRVVWDVPAVGGRIAALLDGRGGGKGSIYQGRATRLDRTPEALALIETLMEEAAS